jgi:hypothetical protein
MYFFSDDWLNMVVAKTQANAQVTPEELAKVKKYIENLEDKLDQKGLFWFFVLADRKVFTPMTGKVTSMTEFRRVFKEKVDKYKNKHLAEVSVWTDPNSESCVMSIKIVMMKINEKGDIANGRDAEDWGSCVNWYPKDILSMRRPFTLKMVNKMVQLTRDKELWNDTLSGNSYSYMSAALAKRGLSMTEDPKQKKTRVVKPR